MRGYLQNLDPDPGSAPEKPESRKTQTLKNMDPKKIGTTDNVICCSICCLKVRVLRDICIFRQQNIPQAYTEPWQTSKMEHFVETVNG